MSIHTRAHPQKHSHTYAHTDLDDELQVVVPEISKCRGRQPEGALHGQRVLGGQRHKVWHLRQPRETQTMNHEWRANTLRR